MKEIRESDTLRKLLEKYSREYEYVIRRSQVMSKYCEMACMNHRHAHMYEYFGRQILEGDDTPLYDDELIRWFNELEEADRQDILKLIEFKVIIKNKKE